jgi:hypothetical protein
MLSFLLLSCAGTTQVHETVSPPRSAARASTSKTAPANASKASVSATGKSAPDGTRDAKTGPSEAEDGWPTQSFAGVDTAAPKDDDTMDVHREVAVKGIEGTTTEYDVRTTLESRAQDFDTCHDRVGGSGGRLVFRIHILANGDVGGVKVSRMKVRNTKLVECYTEVVSSSHFTLPHGGYADVKWTTKVGRSRKRPDALFERKVRWDAPSGSSTRGAKADKTRRGSQSPNGA